MPRISDTAISIITLLNNANELIVQSSNRKDAQEVMKALSIYAKNKTFPMPDEKIDNFYAILLDSKPYVLTSVIMDIANDVMVADIQRKAKSDPKKSV